MHIMFTTDTDNYNAGFFLRDGTWQPAAKAVQTMIQLLPQPKLTGALSDGANGYFAYWFKPRTLMVWNATGPKTVTIPWSGNTVCVVGMLGEEKLVPVANGSVQLRVGPCPMDLH